MCDGDGGGGCGVELFNVSKFNSGVDRVRNADNEDKSSLFCTRIFELNFVPSPLPTGLLTVVAFVLVLLVVLPTVSSTGVAFSVLISSVAIGSISDSVFDSSEVAAAAVDAVFCNDGNSIFEFGRSNFLCLYVGGRSVDNGESVAVDDIDMDVVAAADGVVNAGNGGACIIFFCTKLLKRFIPDAGNADAGGDIVDFFAFNSALKCSG